MGLRNSQRRVNVRVVTPNGEVTLADLGEMTVPLTYEAIRRRIHEELPDTPGSARYIIPDQTRLKFHPTVVVDQGDSCFSLQDNRAINMDETFYSYYSRIYLERHKSNIKIKDNGDSILIGDLQIILHRTIRVPDNNKTHSLPPSMGSFTIRNVADHAEALPESVVEKGGAFITMFQREALWMRFLSPTTCAIKVSVGSINAITGMPRNSSSEGKQDYIPCHDRANQVWLDGVAVKPEVVRQFVAMPLNEGYTVESQVTGSDDVGGIQFDVFWAKKVPEYYDMDNQKWIRGADIEKTPRQLGLVEGVRLQIHDPEGFNPWLNLDGGYSLVPLPSEDAVTLYPEGGQFQIFVKSSDGLTTSIGSFTMNTTIAQLKAEVMKKIRVNLPIQRLLFGQVCLSNDSATLMEYKIVMSQTLVLEDIVIREPQSNRRLEKVSARAFMSLGAMPPPAPCSSMSAPGASRKKAVLGIAPGGTISQKIVRDTLPTTSYDNILSSRVHISIFNSAMCGEIGLPLPTSPVSAQTYINAGYPWFDLYEENVPAVKLPVDGPLQKLKSVAEKEVEKRASGARDPSSGEQQKDCGYCTHQMATVTLVPCNHAFCDDCTEGVGACPTCSSRVLGKRVFAAPMMTPRNEDSLEVDKTDDRVVKLKRVAGTGVVLSFRNAADDVYPLTGGST